MFVFLIPSSLLFLTSYIRYISKLFWLSPKCMPNLTIKLPSFPTSLFKPSSSHLEYSGHNFYLRQNFWKSYYIICSLENFLKWLLTLSPTELSVSSFSTSIFGLFNTKREKVVKREERWRTGADGLYISLGREGFPFQALFGKGEWE